VAFGIWRLGGQPNRGERSLSRELRKRLSPAARLRAWALKQQSLVKMRHFLLERESSYVPSCSGKSKCGAVP
jgi:hypothetical protein